MAPLKDTGAALRKRSQIDKAGRTMFAWTAIASLLVGASLVVSYFFLQQIFYNVKVLGAKSETVSTLNQNLETITELSEEVRLLDVNEDLASVKANESDETLRVVLDALPSSDNGLALGASLQRKLLVGVEGRFELQSLEVTQPENPDESTEVDASADTTGSGEYQSIDFSLTALTDQNGARQALDRLERSIRTIEVTRMNIEIGNSGEFTLRIEGRAFYQPEKTLELTERKVLR